MNQLRVKGKFATKLQKATNDAKKYRDTAEYYLSIVTFSGNKIRRIEEENRNLKNQIYELTKGHQRISGNAQNIEPERNIFT